jgi:hypothetical protein
VRNRDNKSSFVTAVFLSKYETSKVALVRVSDSNSFTAESDPDLDPADKKKLDPDLDSVLKI